MVSRSLVILMAFGAALYRASQGAVIETIGLTALAAGLVLLKVAEKKPTARPIAWMSFGVTALSMAIVFFRM